MELVQGEEKAPKVFDHRFYYRTLCDCVVVMAIDRWILTANDGTRQSNQSILACNPIFLFSFFFYFFSFFIMFFYRFHFYFLKGFSCSILSFSLCYLLYFFMRSSCSTLCNGICSMRRCWSMFPLWMAKRKSSLFLFLVFCVCRGTRTGAACVVTRNNVHIKPGEI